MATARIAVVPAAGLGTRMLPATAAVPKELLPIGGKPAIDWILDEAAIAGIEQVIVVSNPAKPAIEQYLSEAHRMQRRYSIARQSGSLNGDKISLDIRIVYQLEPRGLGDAVRVGRDAAPNEPLAVLLPDELLFGGAALLASMLSRHAQQGRSVLSLMQVPSAEIVSYGCVELADTTDPSSLSVVGCVEKPAISVAPSNYAICGRYVLDVDVLSALDSATPDGRGEIQLTTSLNRAASSSGLMGVELLNDDGRVDIGNWNGWLAANRRAFDLSDLTDAGDRSRDIGAQSASVSGAR